MHTYTHAHTRGDRKRTQTDRQTDTIGEMNTQSQSTVSRRKDRKSKAERKLHKKK